MQTNMKKFLIIIFVVILIIFGVGVYWFLRGGTLKQQTPAPTEMYGMSEYSDPKYGFSFWYPSSLEIQVSATNDAENFPGGIAVETITVGPQGGPVIIVVDSPQSTITDEPNGHASPIAQTKYFYDHVTQKWMVAYPEGAIGTAVSGATTTADISKTTIGGLPMLPSGRRFDTTIILLSTTRFAVVTDGGGSSFTPQLAKTIALIGTSIDQSAQTNALKSEAGAYQSSLGIPASTGSIPPSPSPAPTTKLKASDNTAAAITKSNLFGTMLAYNLNDGFMGITGAIDEFQNGWSVFRNRQQVLTKYLNSLGQVYENRNDLVKKTNFSLDREIAGLFTWNVIEPIKGTFDWRLTDLAAEHAKGAGIKISAVIQPFAGWDQQNNSPIPNCRALDFAWYDYKAGPPNDWSEYQNFLETTIKRYRDVVSDWEIGNEYDGQCGGYQNNPEGYLKLLKTSYEIIKKVDPNAKVLNAGALEFPDASIRNFWIRFFELGGGNYLDAFNIHYNGERNGAKSDPSTFLGVLNFYNNLIKNQGLKKPLWLTEFGTYSGTPESPPPPPGGQFNTMPSLPTQSQEFQATWYFRYSILAFANNVEKIFVDLVGPDNQNIGASAIYNLQGQSRQFLKTLKTIATKLQGFNKATKIVDSQYKFSVGNKTIYALWSDGLPPEINGQVRVINIYGEEQLMNARDIKFSTEEPILIEAYGTQ